MITKSKYTKKIIQLWMAMSLLLLFLKTQNHFEIFEHVWGIDINIIISNTQDHIFILWNQSYIVDAHNENNATYYLNKLCKDIYHIHTNSKFWPIGMFNGCKCDNTSHTCLLLELLLVKYFWEFIIHWNIFQINSHVPMIYYEPYNIKKSYTFNTKLNYHF
jgi:hypothetical protein